MPDLDIVIPLYKTESGLQALVNRLNEWTASVTLSVRVIFVDDGSPDRTFETLTALLPQARFAYKVLRLAVNYGQYRATAVGFSHTEAPLVATLDDDLQHDPFQLNTMIKALIDNDLDLVYGVYEKRHHSFFRTFSSRLLKKILFSDGRDFSAATSFRLMKSNVVAVFKNMQVPVLFVDEYLIQYSRKHAGCVVLHAPRLTGKSNYSNLKLFKIALEILLFHSAIPLKLITRFGLMMSFVFFVLGCFYIWQKMFNDVQLGFTSLVVAIFFSTGMILLSLGIIGEYIRRIWVSQHSLDRIIVAEEIA